MYYIINGLKINIKSDVLSDLKKYYYSSWKYETGLWSEYENGN